MKAFSILGAKSKRIWKISGIEGLLHFLTWITKCWLPFNARDWGKLQGNYYIPVSQKQLRVIPWQTFCVVCGNYLKLGKGRMGGDYVFAMDQDKAFDRVNLPYLSQYGIPFP